MYSVFWYTLVRLSFISLCLFALCVSLSAQALADTDDYLFDNSLLRGNRYNIGSINQFNDADNIEPGTYQIDLFINNAFLEQLDVKFVKSKQGKTLPCFSYDNLIRFGIKPESITGVDSAASSEEYKKQCLIPDEVITGAKSEIEFSKLKLDLVIPQALMNVFPKGYVPPEQLNAGETMFFVNYMANQYHVSYKNSATNKNMDSTYINLNSGFNLGLWRYRQQSFYTKQSRSEDNFVTTSRYVQRAIAPINGELLMGEGYTTGDYFSGMAFRGVSLKSDERMLPDSQQGYAPTIYGIARTNAKVTVTQGGNIIYETTVPPGPFSINDLYNTNYAGDLNVAVQEADGTVSTFVVPYSSVPDSLRAGAHRYSITLGKSRYVGDHDPFTEVVYRHGLTNSITLNSGFQVAKSYQSFLLGGVYTSWFGALGLDMTFSNASLPKSSESGQKIRLSYNKTFIPTNTSLTASSNFYSRSGYRELSDVLDMRESFKQNSDNWRSTSSEQRSRYDLSINQSFGKFGTLYFSGSVKNYYSNHKPDKQLQVSYTKVFSNGVSLNIAVNRSRMGAVTDDNDYLGNMPGYYNPTTGSSGTKETTTLFSLSIPLGKEINSPTFSNSVSHSDVSGTSYQSTVSGTVGEKQNLNYSLNYSTDSKDHTNTWNGTVQSRLPVGTLGVSAGKSRTYSQNSVTMQGTVVLHRGGITLGPYAGDTFALIEADGASGASIMGGQGASIDRFGYALIPSLTPYRYNNIALNPEGMSTNVELQSGQYRLAPYAGANVKIKFRTIKGYPILISAIRPKGADILPMGADVYNEDNESVGMVGQGGQIYIRSDREEDRLTVLWGNTPEEQCHLTYNLKGQDLDQPLIMLKATCD
ncbi:fimbrial protein [Gammaproteobacteria bacterium ESL0073]|nr:fimbrial protein [Gammaproteobacteria bacterium ESL0073]